MNTRKILLSLIPISVIINTLILSNVDILYLREIFASLFTLLLPGFLLSWIIKLKFRNFWEFSMYSLGLSLALLMLLGLGINFILPFVGIKMPLSLIPALASIDVLVLMFGSYLFIRNEPLLVEKPGQKKLQRKNLIMGSLPFAFPILSILGAISLNNNGSNIFTMIMLGLIAFYVLLLTILREKISKHIFPLALFMISTSLLFMTSLRGWFITGHDIYLEYYIFQVTKAHGIWNMANFQDPYNACLSITILPTILANITHISDFYIYKGLYQIIFSFSVVGTFLFIRRFITSFLAFLSTFAIVSLPTFMTDMPMLNRQEIAFFFFVLLLNTLFNDVLSKKKKWLLFIIFGFGLLLSHYSTTYITVGLFIFAALIGHTLQLIKKHKSIKKFINYGDRKLGLVDSKLNLHIGMAVLLFAATIFWNVTLTNTASGITKTLDNVGKDIETLHIGKAKSDPGAYSILSTKAPTNNELLNKYIDTESAFVRKFNDDSAFFAKQIYSKYNVDTGAQIKLSLTGVGNVLADHRINVFSFNDDLKQLYAKLMQLFIIIGFVAIFLQRKHIKRLEKEYLILTGTFFFILVLQVVLPSGSIDYGILRLFQQGLILFSVPMLMGAYLIFGIFDRIHTSIKIYLTSFFFIFFFLYLSGFISTLTGGYYPQLNLANGGFYYDAYYTHTKDLTAMNWLSDNRNKKIPVQSDWFTLKRIHTYEGFYSIDGLIPSIIRRESYVFLSVSNLQTGNVIIYANGAPLYYKLSPDFLDQNKNLIYNNGGSKIYR